MTLHRFEHLPEPPEVDHDRADELIEALDRSLSAIAHARLEAAVVVINEASARNGLKEAFQRVDVTGLPQTLLRHCAALRDDTMSLEERLMILSEMDSDKTILLAQAGAIRADDVMLSAAFSARPKDFIFTWEKLSDFAQGDRQELLDTALSLCAYPQELENGHDNTCDIKKVQKLIDLGANVNAHDIWAAVVENAEHDVKTAFIKAGADAAPYFEAINEDSYSYNYRQDVLKQLAGTAVYTRLDDNTLEQTIFKRPLDWNHRLVTLYRFDLGRITETQQDGDNAFPPQAMSFADTPLQTLEAMREKLIELGGKPMSLSNVMRTSHASPIIKSPVR